MEERDESMIRGSGTYNEYSGVAPLGAATVGVGSTMHSGVHSPTPFTTSATPLEIRHPLVKQIAGFNHT